MAQGTKLLNDDGSASMATLLMMSHHAFRRDIARLAVALERIARGDSSRAQLLRAEWGNYRGALHGHHEREDSDIFPGLKHQVPALAAAIEQLSADHRRIDPLLERGDRAFGELPQTGPALAVVAELAALLDAHLTSEEAQIAPHLRAAKEFPPPASDAEAELYADGFAWSTQGIAQQVLEQVYAILPSNLRSRLPAAQAAFEARCERVWGSAKTGASYTSHPDG